ALRVPVGFRRGRLERDRRGIVRRTRGRSDSRDAAPDRCAEAAGGIARGAVRAVGRPGPGGARHRPRHRARVGADMIGGVRGRRRELQALLADPPERTIDAAFMAGLAERHWDDLGRKATEAWVYYGWVVYFDDAAVVGTVRRVSRLEPRYD